MSAEENLCPSINDSMISYVGVRCIIDLTFLSHNLEIENNTADIKQLFKFSDFSDRHWCSCHLSCACWPKMNTIFRAKQESKSQSNRDVKAGQSHIN